MPSFAFAIIVLGGFLPGVIIAQSPIPAGTPAPGTGVPGDTGPPATLVSPGSSDPTSSPGLVPTPGYLASNCSSVYAVRGNETMAFSLKYNETTAICMQNYTQPNEYHCAVRKCSGNHACSTCTEMKRDGTLLPGSPSNQNCSLAFLDPGQDPKATQLDPNPLALCMNEEKRFFQCDVNTCTGSSVCSECVSSRRENFEGTGTQDTAAGNQGNAAPTGGSTNTNNV